MQAIDKEQFELARSYLAPMAPGGFWPELVAFDHSLRPFHRLLREEREDSLRTSAASVWLGMRALLAPGRGPGLSNLTKKEPAAHVCRLYAFAQLISLSAATAVPTAAVETATSMKATPAVEGASAVEATPAAYVTAAEAFPTTEPSVEASTVEARASAVETACAIIATSAPVAVIPRTRANKDAVQEPARPIVSVGCAGIRVIRVITIRAHRRRPIRRTDVSRTTNPYSNRESLSVSVGCGNQQRPQNRENSCISHMILDSLRSRNPKVVSSTLGDIRCNRRAKCGFRKGYVILCRKATYKDVPFLRPTAQAEEIGFF